MHRCLFTHLVYAVSTPPPFDPSVFETLRDSIGGDTDFLADLVGDYLEDGQELLDTMQAAVDNNNVDLLERCAHSLKSTSQTVGALALADACATIEQHAHNDDLQRAGQYLSNAATHFAAAKHRLQDRKMALEAE
jgi:HPt (histidine-containing phosphotransfer) domain-containing protein